jgi:hypothetical protein
VLTNWYDLPVVDSSRDDEDEDEDEDDADGKTAPAGPAALLDLRTQVMAALATVREDPYVGIMVGFAGCILVLIAIFLFR